MAYCHRATDARSCGATTLVTGQTFLTVDGKLWAVNGDKNTHGNGDLITTHNWLTINGKGVIVVGDHASSDGLCAPLGGNHCDPQASGFSSLINVG